MATQLKERPDAIGGEMSRATPGYDRDRLRALLAQRTLKRGEFKLASGRRSRIYFNVKTTMMHPEGAAHSARGLLALLDTLEVDYIGGLEMGAVPLLSVISAFSADRAKQIPSFFVRKSPKAHGTQAMIEGLDDIGEAETLSGKRVVLIDDVATTGGSIVQAVDQIEAGGGIVTDAVVVLDREEGAAEALKARGIALHALFTAQDLGVTDADRAPID